jgi:ubiquinone/menaquinone biosynthesis C-methylase UbiE
MSSGRAWPKQVLTLTPEEEAIKKQVSLESQEWGYRGLLGWVQTQGHIVAERLSVATRGASKAVFRSLEIGCGSGYHFRFAGRGQDIGLDFSAEHLRHAQQQHAGFPLVQGDAYKLPFKSSVFDRVVSIYNFEHLNRLPECLLEVRRVLKTGGELIVGLPAEGGFIYEWGRRLTTKRHFERKYDVDYMRLVRSEHCNTCQDVIEELRDWFSVQAVRYLPLMVPSVHLNAVVVLRCVNRQTGETSDSSGLDRSPNQSG